MMSRAHLTVVSVYTKCKHKACKIATLLFSHKDTFLLLAISLRTIILCVQNLLHLPIERGYLRELLWQIRTYLQGPPGVFHQCTDETSLHRNVVFTFCARMGNATYIIFIMCNSISSLDIWFHFQYNISCGVAVT